MNKTDNLTTVAELVIAMPSARGLLEHYRIDYCCNGQQTVSDACAARGITVDELLASIETAPQPAAERAWAGASMGEMIRFIVDTHHRYTRDALSALVPLAQKVRDVHGERRPELSDVLSLVTYLANELRPHMLKEEQVLFPYVISLEEAVSRGEEPPTPFFGTLKNPVRMMMSEHEAAGEKLAELRAITNDYALPEDACSSYRLLFEKLPELENDLHRHIHLENNILFPKALEMESAVERPELELVGGGCGGSCKH